MSSPYQSPENPRDISNEAFREEWEEGYFDATMGNSFRPPVGKLSRKIAYTEGYETGMKEMGHE